jgi:hypothetical protein
LSREEDKARKRSLQHLNLPSFTDKLLVAWIFIRELGFWGWGFWVYVCVGGGGEKWTLSLLGGTLMKQAAAADSSSSSSSSSLLQAKGHAALNREEAKASKRSLHMSPHPHPHPTHKDPNPKTQPACSLSVKEG